MEIRILIILAVSSHLTFADEVFNPETIPLMPNATYSCRMWGYCYEPEEGIKKSCIYDGPARQLFHDGLTDDYKQEVLDALERRCPYILYDDDGNRKPNDEIFTCCSAEQFMYSAEALLMADGVIGRCPACARNFARQICEMNCSPEQSRFIDVATALSPHGDEYITDIDYRMYTEFMDDSFNACIDVILPQTGLPAVNLMCGSAPVCTAQAWYSFSGDTSENPFVHVHVNFLRWNTSEDSMNAEAIKCHESYGSDYPCSCVDCISTCPTDWDPTVPPMCTVLSLNCFSFSIGITFFVISITTFSLITVYNYRNSARSTNTKSKSKTKVNKVTNVFENIFSVIGKFSASNSVFILLVTSWIVFGMSYGIYSLKVTSNPIELWSSPESKSRQHYDYFNSRFGPFYRASQVFLTVNLEPITYNNITLGPAFQLEALQELISLENKIINIGRNTDGVKLEDVCFSPLLSRGFEPDLDLCTIMSASTYLRDKNNINSDTYISEILSCINNVYSLQCLSSWGGGVEAEMAFGGFQDDVLAANTLLMTIPLTNHLSPNELVDALHWEKQFLELLSDYENNDKPKFIDITYAAERSIEDEIERVSRAESIPIATSYVIMFIYVTISLGKFKSCKTLLLNSKVLVAVASILVVLCSIFCALGTMGFAGVSTTMLAISVIPFFILSVGIDNVFLFTNTLYDLESNMKQFEDYYEDNDFDKKRTFLFGKILKKVGPSIFVSSASQITCFMIGLTANFPAVKTFAFFASLSLIYLFIFQVTTVVAILSIDYKRESKNRLDIFFCMKKKILDDSNPLQSDQPYVSITQRLMVPYSKLILNWKVKIIVAISFMTILSTSIVLIPHIEVGLDQLMALPTDSYVYKYLHSISHITKIGVPVYFVLTSGLNFTDPIHQNAVCGGQMCDIDSLNTQIFLASLQSEVTYVLRSSNSWLDDYFDWTILSGACCRYNIDDHSFCQSSNTSALCKSCEIETYDNNLRPTAEAFASYLTFFLQDAPTEMCTKGGLASYYNNVNYILDEQGRAIVHDSNFMAYHSSLSTSYDYITAVKYGYSISENITKSIREKTGTDVEVFPYSVFYPFYEQYLTMWSDTAASIGYSLLGTLIINFIMSGFNILTTFAVMFTTTMIVIEMMGMMYIWNIPLNAVSCVNLIISIGIGVEFCSHLVYAFATSKQSSHDKIADALKAVGSTVITGITFTNIPIVMLAFSYTPLIEVFFFRMFFGLVILGFVHGMIFLPVLLSYLIDIRSLRD